MKLDVGTPEGLEQFKLIIQNLDDKMLLNSVRREQLILRMLVNELKYRNKTNRER